MSKERHVKVENVNYPWPKQYITRAEVRALGPGIPANMDVFLKRGGKPGVLVADENPIDLDEPGIEKFYAQDPSSEAGQR